MAKNKDNNQDKMEMPGMRKNSDVEAGVIPEPQYSEVDTSGLRTMSDPEVRHELGLDERSTDPNDLNNATMNGHPEIKEIADTLQKGLDEAEELKGEAMPGMKQNLGKVR